MSTGHESCAAKAPVTEPAPAIGATVNPCTLCAPLGAALVTSGVRGAIALLHGGQGCATYIRRYLISHFREPVDIASSSFGETQTVFGGEDNLSRALDNVEQQYHPELITVATTCVAETVGEDVPLLLRRYNSRRQVALPVIHASTPSYKDGHIEGFHAMVHELVKEFATGAGPTERTINLLPSLVSPADLRHLRQCVEAFGLDAIMVPDYSTTLDGVVLGEYRSLPEGGTPLTDIARMPRARATLDLTMPGRTHCASAVLEGRGVRALKLGLPIGVRAMDALVQSLERETGLTCPAWLNQERGQLLDAYADGHKYVFGKRVAIYGEPELVAAVALFVAEIGANPVVCATGARNRVLSRALESTPLGSRAEILDDTDFAKIESACQSSGVELLVGNSKGYSIARRLGVPLIRIGFPVHDRIGASRIQILGYRGSLWLFDSIVNAILQLRQDSNEVGYSYL